MTTHLTDAEIGRFAAGGLGPDERLAADDHLAGCASCRERAAALSGADARLEGLDDDLHPPGSHLSDEDVTRFVDGSLPGAAAARAAAHVAACGVCAEQVRDLRTWLAPAAAAAARRPRRMFHAAVAAVLAVVVPGLAWFLWTRAHDDRALPGLATLQEADQRRVRDALAAGAALPPPWIADLTGAREVLMGGPAPPPAFTPTAPVATAVLTDRPRFQWQALPGAASYTVEVFDEDLRPVTSSPPLAATEWAPEQGLPRGQNYTWQVTALRGAESVIAPRAPAPAVRFRVADAEAAARIERVQAAHPDAHLLLGILYLQAGALPEARRELGSVPPTDPHAAVARRSLERISP